MEQKRPQNNLLPKEYDTLISLLNVYLSEWKHREQFLWKQIFQFYFAILILILFPNLTCYFEMSLPLPNALFRIIGLLFSVVLLYISIGYVIRFQAIGDTYQLLINKLPEEYRRRRIDAYKIGRFFSLKMTYLICVSLFLTLFVLAIVLLII